MVSTKMVTDKNKNPIHTTEKNACVRIAFVRICILENEINHLPTINVGGITTTATNATEYWFMYTQIHSDDRKMNNVNVNERGREGGVWRPYRSDDGQAAAEADIIKIN